MTCLLVANIIGVKLVSVAGLVVPAAIVVFPISYIFGDVLTEVYGYSRSRQVIWIGFGCNLLAVLFIWVGQVLPPAGFWGGQGAYETILGYTPRLLAASVTAYVIGEFLNSYVMAKMKIASKGRLLWARTIGSTLVGQLADSVVFIVIAFVGTISAAQLIQVILTHWLLKSGYETVATPATYAIVNYLKRVEHEDYFDHNTDFHPLHIS